jgi:hypothetical protein
MFTSRSLPRRTHADAGHQFIDEGEKGSQRYVFAEGDQVNLVAAAEHPALTGEEKGAVQVAVATVRQFVGGAAEKQMGSCFARDALHQIAQGTAKRSFQCPHSVGQLRHLLHAVRQTANG